MIDRDEDGYPTPFWAEAEPCESCGEPTYRTREWNEEHQLWIAVDCSCGVPDESSPACLIAVYEAARTVGELITLARAHKQSCPVCTPSLPMRPALLEQVPGKRKDAQPRRVSSPLLDKEAA